jgi:hypothetical protein
VLSRQKFKPPPCLAKQRQHLETEILLYFMRTDSSKNTRKVSRPKPSYFAAIAQPSLQSRTIDGGKVVSLVEVRKC